jgi:hypothetical protein
MISYPSPNNHNHDHRIIVDTKNILFLLSLKNFHGLPGRKYTRFFQII